jgi:diguanylate cyclase (GGDEF)-like protein
MLALFVALATTAHAIDPDRGFDQYVRRTWLATEGLPQNSVTSIVQSADGYLWLGTWGGLAKFDGISFQTFDASTSPALRSSRIVALGEDAAGRLWIGTERGGLVRYDGGHFERIHVTDGESLSVHAIARDPGGSMWVGTDRGLFRFDRETSRRFDVSDGLPGDEVMSILFLRDGRALIGTMSGIAIVDRAAIAPFATSLSGVAVRALLETGDGTVLAGSQAGLFRIEPDQGASATGVLVQAGLDIASLFEDQDGNVWAGTSGNGLIRLRGGAIETIRRRDGLSSDSVRTIFEDRERNLWIGTDGGGLMLVRDGKAISWGGPGSPLGRSIVPIESDGRGGLWIGMACGGLANMDEDGSIRVFGMSDGLPDDCIWALMRDTRGLLWIGSAVSGVARWDGRSFQRVRDSTGRNLNVNAFLEDGRGRLWAGSSHGLLAYEEDSDEFVQVPGTEPYHVSNILEARDGTLWIATNRGILIFDGTIREVVNAADGLANEFVRAIHEDDQGVFWIGTYGGGLHRIARGQVSQFGTRDGLFDDIVSRIFETAEGDLWMSGNRGISRVRKADLESYLAGKLDRIPAETIGTHDGMINAECNGGGHPAGIRTADGKMWFPTVDGIVMIDPARVRRNTLAPPVLIDSVHVGGAPLALADAIVLPRGAKNLEIRYTALSFAAPELVRFRYRLVGLDGDWIDAGARRVAYYPYIPHGDYTFQVIAANNDGVWNDTGASLGLSLAPRLYQRSSVWAALLLAAAALAWVAYRVRLAGVERRAQELARLVVERTAELEHANRELQELALVDSLTGVANHRRFREFLGLEWRRCLRERRTIALALLDIDFFKRFNDAYGHQAGDECLRRVAEAMASALQRPTDLLARYGGEEFVAVVANFEAGDVSQFAERLRSRVEQLAVPHLDSPVARVVTITAGVCTMVPDDECTMDDLIQCADRALYEGKRQGRNRVVVGNRGGN